MLQILKNWADNYFSDEEAVYLLVLLVAGALVILFFGGMLAPVLTAIVLAYLLQGLVSALERRGMSSFLAVNLVFTLFMGLLVATLVVLLPMVWRQTFLLVRDQLPYMLKNGEVWLRALPQRYPEVLSMEQVDSMVSMIHKEVAQAGQSVLTLSLASIPNLVELMVFLVLVPLLVYFFLKDRRAILDWFVGLLPQQRRILSHVWQEMDGQIANYVRGKAIEILVVGVASFIAFLLMGLNYTVLLAVLVGLSVVVPYIGATVVTLPVAAVGYVQFGWSGDF
ncbi:MAG: AI-2E family transporter, partial [Alcanivorax sp.]|nr:AI-2E family transporter [Alcanivorax sp.]